MQKYWLTKEGNPSVIVFALGWAADHHSVKHIRPQGYDILCLYDYRTIEPVEDGLLAGYDKKYLFAWSFGVWASEQIFQSIRFIKAIALCGTPYPVHDRYGIPEKIMAITIKGMMHSGIDEFNRRTYGEFYDRMLQFPETRTLDEKYDELQTLARMSVKPYSPSIEWDKAVIAARDVIFPRKNTENYWQDKGVEADFPHYPFGDPEIVAKNL